MTSCRRRWSATLSGSLVFFLSLVAVCFVPFVFLSWATGVVCYFKYLIIVSSFPLPLAYSFKENSTWHRHDLFKENKKQPGESESGSQVALGAADEMEMEMKTMRWVELSWGRGWDNRWQASLLLFFALETEECEEDLVKSLINANKSPLGWFSDWRRQIEDAFDDWSTRKTNGKADQRQGSGSSHSFWESTATTATAGKTTSTNSHWNSIWKIK